MKYLFKCEISQMNKPNFRNYRLENVYYEMLPPNLPVNI